MANPSHASYKARVGRYYRRVVELCEIGEPISPEVVRALVEESLKLDEVFVYLHGRTGPDESVKQWRTRLGDAELGLSLDTEA